MTVKRYLFDSSLTGTALITEVGNDGKPWVRLDETLMHPQGGGQKADRGTINDHLVTHVAHVDGQINHYLNENHTLQVGQQVTITVDEVWRITNSKLHTGGHLIAALMEQLFAGLKAVGAHHWSGEARVEFVGENIPQSDLVQKKLGEALKQAIQENLPVSIIGDPITSRAIQIGAFPAVSCGGTHLENLGVLDQVKITAVKVKGGKLRLSYCIEDASTISSIAT